MKRLMTTSLLLLFLTACSADEDPNENLSTEIIDVHIQVQEEQPVNEPFTLQTQVMQGDDFVEDAHEVLYEVWQNEHRDDAEFIEASHSQDGIYRAEIELETDGVYIVQAHVTARDMHVMPTQEFFVGEVSEEEKKAFYDED
ncbi:YznA protein [Bacillus sp. JCM 19046]|nr:YznA protein [Bacillus sp. JCM 19045]GAF16431.1 YznA protein [Bacillus sp. JCM 19046]